MHPQSKRTLPRLCSGSTPRCVWANNLKRHSGKKKEKKKRRVASSGSLMYCTYAMHEVGSTVTISTTAPAPQNESQREAPMQRPTATCT